MPRLLFEKTGPAVFISHLDLMRVFQRAFRRAGILIRHSQGFTPRAHVAIALPLSVGSESVCELLDFDLAEGVTVPPEEIPECLNSTMPAGIRVLSIWESGRKLRELTHLEAELTLEYDKGAPADIAEALTAFFTGDNPLVVPKRTKSGEMTDLDIRPMILRLEASLKSPQEVVIMCRICAQNPSLNPVLLQTALTLHKPELAPDFMRIRRLDVLDASGNPFR